MLDDIHNTVGSYCEQGRFPEHINQQLYEARTFPEARTCVRNAVGALGTERVDHVDLVNNMVRMRSTTRNTHVVSQPVVNTTHVVSQPIVHAPHQHITSTAITKE